MLSVVCPTELFMHVNCPLPSDTEHCARQLALQCPKGVVVYLYGDLGAGKSTFARAFLQQLGVQGPIKSPTYTLLEVYPLPDGSDAVHMDMYRIADPEEVDYLALGDYERSASVTFIEWPEKGLGHIPVADLSITFTHSGLGRLLTFKAENSLAENWLKHAFA